MTDGSSQAATPQTPTPTSPSSASPASAIAEQVSPSASSAPQASTVDMAALLGPDYSKDPMLKVFKDPQALAKAYIETKTLVGQPKFDVPAQDAAPEVVTEFYKKLGVPETADAYALKADANVPEHANETNTAFLKAFSETAHGLKLTSQQATGMQKFFDDLAVNMGKTQEERATQEDAQIDELFTKVLGAEKLVASERIKSIIENVVPAELRNVLADKLNPEALTAIAMIERHMRETYGQSDQNAGDTTVEPSGKSIMDLQKEGKELYAQIQKNGLTHPSYAADKAKYDQIYKSITELTKAQTKR